MPRSINPFSRFSCEDAGWQGYEAPVQDVVLGRVVGHRGVDVGRVDLIAERLHAWVGRRRRIAEAQEVGAVGALGIEGVQGRRLDRDRPLGVDGRVAVDVGVGVVQVIAEARRRRLLRRRGRLILAPAMITSLPAPPSSESFPGPPIRVSSPDPPAIVTTPVQAEASIKFALDPPVKTAS